MKLSAGLVFMVSALLLGVAALVGGQLWALTGSTPLAWCAGAVSLALLTIAAEALRRTCATRRSVRFLGELKAFDRDDFVDAVRLDADDGPRSRIEDKVQEKPERVAGSIRSLLSERGKGGPR